LIQRKLIIGIIAGILAGNALLAQKSQLESFKDFKNMEESSPFRTFQWQSVGPSFQGGRVESIDCPPGQPGIIYAGFGSGSLWKTTNQGLTWKCIFQDEASFSIGDVAVSPSNPEVIYLGTGEGLRATRGYTFVGSGIYKSVNGGKKWTFTGLPDSHHIGRLVIDPNDPDMVFAAVMGHMWSKNTERGLYMTRDGGNSWSRILYISDSVGVADAVWDPVNKTLYAASWEMIQGKGSGIYRSTDLGQTWKKCTDGFPENAGIGRIGLAVSPTHPNTVYAVVDNRNKIQGKETTDLIGAEIYRSDDSGLHWSRTHSGLLDIYSNFGWAFGDIRVSPVNSKKIYVLGVQTIVSIDGGKSFARLSGLVHHLEPNRGNFLHLDHHDLYLDPLNPDYMVLGNDGGVYVTQDAGFNWLHCNTIPTGEFYDLYIDESQGVPVAYGGTQDNSCVFGSLDGISDGGEKVPWQYVWLDPWSGGDGFTARPDPESPDYVYYASQNGNLNRKDIRTGESKYIAPSAEKGESPIRTSWFTPWFISGHTGHSIYYGANKVYRSINKGDSWYRLSPDLCYSEEPQRKSRALTALAESPVKQGLLYAGTEKGALWISRDDGINWIEISKTLPVKSVNSLCPSVHLEGRVYCVLRGLDEDDYLPYLYISENKGVTWKSITAGLPRDRINCIIEDPENQNLIYIGTDRGIFLSPDLGESWVALSSSLPTASVQKLAWAAGHAYLVAATHGLSLFTLFAEPIRHFYQIQDSKQEHLLGVKPGKLPDSNDFTGDYDWNSLSLTEVYWYQPSAGSMVIILTDSSDKQVFGTRFDAVKGINVWRWNQVTGYEEDPGLYPIPEIKFPAPGNYILTIQGQGMIIKSDLVIR
jgi:photosystem II stability/assembly factor-like uncharacterized protein